MRPIPITPAKRPIPSMHEAAPSTPADRCGRLRSRRPGERRALPDRSRLGTLLLLLASCDGPQSALSPAGRDAERIAELFWWMTGGAVVIWGVVLGVAVYAVVWKQHAHSDRVAKLLILGGGVVFPTVTLCALLLYGLSMMPPLLDLGPPGGMRVEVAGERWWWRVRYVLEDGRSVELANEIALPIGERVPFALTSPDVIHSFWVPSLGGKMDMVPGRVTHLALEPTQVGIYRGACAEYCGSSHARMNFYARVLPQEAFEAWLAHQMEPARPPRGALEARGAALFLANGCGACHTVRGTDADGTVGPDLTHVGSRYSLGAGILENDVDSFARWIARTEHLKPGVNMPTFHMLEDGDLLAIAAYLEGLE